MKLDLRHASFTNRLLIGSHKNHYSVNFLEAANEIHSACLVVGGDVM